MSAESPVLSSPSRRPRVTVAAGSADRGAAWETFVRAAGCEPVVAETSALLDSARATHADAVLAEPPLLADMAQPLILGPSTMAPLPVGLIDPCLLAQDARDLERHVSQRTTILLRLRAMGESLLRRQGVLAALGVSGEPPENVESQVRRQPRTVLVAGQPGPDYARIEALCASDSTTVVGAFTPAITVEFLARHRFDVLVMTPSDPGDRYLPVIAALRRNPRMASTPVLMMTRDASPETVRGVLEAGATGLLPRGLEDADIARRLDLFLIESVLGRVLKERLDQPAPQGLRDETTGLAAPAFWEAHLDRMVTESHATRRPWCAVIMDLSAAQTCDGSTVATSDAAFAEASSLIAALARTEDFKARTGSREVALVLPATALEGGAALMDRVCGALGAARVGATPRSGGQAGGVTVRARHAILSPALEMTTRMVLAALEENLVRAPVPEIRVAV